MRLRFGATVALAVFLAVPPARADVAAAARYSARHGEVALLVWEDGRTVLERELRPGAPSNAFSITKSLAALGVLHAAGRGRLRLDEPAGREVPEWKADSRKRDITLRDLLTQTSGLAPSADRLYAPGLRSKSQAALRVPAVARPGKIFAYGPAHYEALEAILTRRTGRPPENWFALPRTAWPTGTWRRDGSGRVYFSAGAQVTPRQLLEAGHILRRHGRSGWFSYIPAPLLREATTGTPANRMYGMGFWLNANARRAGATERDVEEALGAGLAAADWARACLSRQAPPDLIAMVGSRGQRVYVVPSRNQVIIRLGRTPGFRDPEFLAALY